MWRVGWGVGEGCDGGGERDVDMAGEREKEELFNSKQTPSLY